MARVTEPDKVDVRVSPSDRINKYEAADFNELKAAINALYDIEDIDRADIDDLIARVVVLEGSTGWAVYNDTEYTSANPLELFSGVQIDLPNNAGGSNVTQQPIDIAKMYDAVTQKITGRNGDGINITLSFNVRPTTQAVTRVTVVPDIAGAIGEIDDYKRDVVFSKGQNLEQNYLSSFDAFTLDTWEANGAQLRIEADAACDIYDIRLLLTRTHKAR